MATPDMDQANRYLLHKQHLAAASRTDDILQITRDICGLHGTSPTTPYLSLLARTKCFSRESLDEAMYVQKSLIRARCMRGTIYVLPLDLFSLAYQALKAPMIQMCTSYCERRGISKAEYADASKQVLTALENGGLTATEIKRTTGLGLSLSPILVLMCDQGLIVRGAPRGGWASNKHSYHLFKQYLSDADLSGTAEPDAISGLIQAYLKAFGPATETDITWWTGLTKAKVRKGLADLTDTVSGIEVSGLDGDFLLLAADKKALSKGSGDTADQVSLLPTLDGFVMGY